MTIERWCTQTCGRHTRDVAIVVVVKHGRRWGWWWRRTISHERC